MPIYSLLCIPAYIFRHLKGDTTEMKKNVLRVLALALSVIMLLACASCTQTILVRFVDKDGNDIDLSAISVGGGGSGGGSAAPAASTDTTPAPAADTTAAPAADAQPADSGDSAAPAAEPAAADASGLPADGDKEAILAYYSNLVNTMKAGKPAYKKIEWQELPEGDRDFGTMGKIILPIAEGMLTSKDKASGDPSIHNQGDDANNIPVNDNAKGCLLTDASKIKSASCKDNGDGTATITITLIDEDDALPAEAGAETAPSYTGAMFNPMSKSGIDDIISKFSAVATVNTFKLTYTDATVTCVFDKDTQKVKSLSYVLPCLITANAKVTLLTIDGKAKLIDYIEVTEIAY